MIEQTTIIKIRSTIVLLDIEGLREPHLGQCVALVDTSAPQSRHGFTAILAFLGAC